ncbi:MULTISPECIES: hypothetical protein [Streptomyces]|uniref:Uncharacterized protein n=3 Tax=Streptomyces TaxID=1883 RepID=M3CUR1_STREZ|nr:MULTISPECIES: hypothetical protein [Streptomyces pseudogriseolus group]EMF27808.1 hypothetical protein H114_17093 [Streptomyces gancidicus BKS 13-15]GGP94454.1 hypothetical protein GCM10010233_08360 [Streptomyces gancidicus]GGS52581.1 hypothetical protein GCM10010285_35080 [Streptomyces rubiginosus]
MTTVECRQSPRGFNLVPPPGWDVIPLRVGTREAMDRIVRKAVAQLPPGFPKDDIPKARLKLTREMKKVVRRAGAKGGMTLYLPTEPLHGIVLPASIVASEPIEIPRVRPNSGPEAVLAALASVTPGVETRELDGVAALRSERDIPGNGDEGVDVAHRQVEYFVPIPDSIPDRYLTFSFSALIAPGSDPPFYDTLVELFDAVMGTFRWAYE